MKVLFVTEYNPMNIRIRSGVPFHIWSALNAIGCTCDYLHVQDNRKLFHKLLSRFWQSFIRVFVKGNKFYDASWSMNMAKSYWYNISNREALKNYDIILTISPRTVAYMPSHKCLVIWIDNTLETYAKYPEMMNLSKKSKKQGQRVEFLAFSKAFLIFTASEYLKEFLNLRYPQFNLKVSMMPRGANLNRKPAIDIVQSSIDSRMNQHGIKLLHIVSGGFQHDRKGTRLTLEVYKTLKLNHNVSLTIIGGLPEKERDFFSSIGVNCLGSLNKEDSSDLRLYETCLLDSNWLIVPSKAEGFGIIYAEAAWHGLPSIALSIMGVESSVSHGVTGFLFPEHTDSLSIASKIIAVSYNSENYRQLCVNARHYAMNTFDWVKNLADILKIAQTS